MTNAPAEKSTNRIVATIALCALLIGLSAALVFAAKTDGRALVDHEAYYAHALIHRLWNSTGEGADPVEAVRIPSFQVYRLTNVMAYYAMRAFGPSPFLFRLTQLPFLISLVLATYILARSQSGRGAALAAAAFVGTLPLIIEGSRTYHLQFHANAIFLWAIVLLAHIPREKRTLFTYGALGGILAAALLVHPVALLLAVPVLVVTAYDAIVLFREKHFFRGLGTFAAVVAPSILVILFQAEADADYWATRSIGVMTLLFNGLAVRFHGFGGYIDFVLTFFGIALGRPAVYVLAGAFVAACFGFLFTKAPDGRRFGLFGWTLGLFGLFLFDVANGNFATDVLVLFPVAVCFLFAPAARFLGGRTGLLRGLAIGICVAAILNAGAASFKNSFTAPMSGQYPDERFFQRRVLMPGEDIGMKIATYLKSEGLGPVVSIDLQTEDPAPDNMPSREFVYLKSVGALYGLNLRQGGQDAEVRIEYRYVQDGESLAPQEGETVIESYEPHLVVVPSVQIERQGTSGVVAVIQKQRTELFE
jgi:4-amino-4-deoxy-L-arabinose transferase-like glycosyltransferase